jgi:hypothetical protein
MQKSGKAFEELDLKYCERCGVLWLRRKGEERVYCVVCVPKMNEMPVPQKRSRPRLQVRAIDLEGAGDSFVAVDGGLL